MATSGLKTLHSIDKAIAKARKAVGEASVLPSRTSQALIDVQRQQASAYGQIASDRLDLLDQGEGGDLGYVDRQAAKLLDAHEAEEAKLAGKVVKSLARIETLEAERRKAEKATLKAVDSYDKAAADAEAKIIKDPDYVQQIARVETAESTVIRADEKLGIAREDEAEKGTPYRQDKFFNYLQARRYGTKEAKGWFLTKWLDGWVARKVDYRQAAENYRRLTAIPVRLEAHVQRLEDDAAAQREILQQLEADILKREGVTAKRTASLKAQKKLDEIDAKIEQAEDAHQALRSEQSDLTSGQSGPHKEAIALISEALQRKDLRSLRRLAAQTQTRDDDRAIEDLRELARTARDLGDDQAEARSLLKKYQKTLAELEAVRRRFKNNRYDAPSSVFNRGDLVGAMLGQVLAGMLSGDDLWQQIQRAQRTMRRYSDSDFGGIDWTEGLRLPRIQRRGGWGIQFPTGGTRRSSGGWGSGGGSRRRTSIPRMPRQSLPKISFPKSGGRRSGGFRRGGGF